MSRYGVTEREAAAAREAALEVLAAGPMTRRAIREHVIQRIKLGKKARLWFEKSFWGVVHQAIVEGLICYGEERGRDITLVRVDQWLPKFEPVTEIEAQQFVLRRYLGAY